MGSHDGLIFDLVAWSEMGGRRMEARKADRSWKYLTWNEVNKNIRSMLAFYSL